MEALTDYLIDVATVLVNMPLNVTEKFYVVYLATFIGLAWISYRLYYRKRTKKGFWRFLFPTTHRKSNV